MKPSIRTFVYKFFPLAVSIFLLNCSNQSVNGSENDANDSQWLIPPGEIRDGGPGKDGIPALNAPVFVAAADVSYLNDGDLVIALKIHDQVKVYPHRILDWHEIINDGIGDDKFSITYCPLTGSGMAWNRMIDGQETTFGVSGLLFNNNLIPYDRRTDSNWSQMKLMAVNGELIGTEVSLFPIVETTWGFIKQFFPASEVVSNNTGVYSPGQYQFYPYGDYRSDHNSLLFSITNDDKRLPRKERIHGILFETGTQVFRFSAFSGELQVINLVTHGKPIVVAGSEKNNFIVSFYRNLTGSDAVLEFSAVENDLPHILKDQHGTVYNLFGEATSGPGQGTHLTATRSYNAYWFAWGAFWPDAEIFGLSN